MKYNPNIHHRKTIRLQGYDYSLEGEYFVTICTKDKECIFGEIIGEEMHLSPIGEIAKRCWEEIPKHFPNTEIDEYVIMPNHVHGIIIINQCRDVQLNVPTRISPKKGSLSVIVRTFKAAVTTECHRIGFTDFKWQPSFYEHIIRNEKDLANIRDYIYNNIDRWTFDQENDW